MTPSILPQREEIHNLPAQSRIRVYTAGYQGHTPDALLLLAQHLHAGVVDVRYHAASANPRWRLTFLTRLFGNRYLHLPQWGNVRYKIGLPIQISDFDSGLDIFEDEYARLPYTAAILLCQCRDADCCHRTELANRLRDLGYAVQELDWWQSTSEGTDHA